MIFRVQHEITFEGMDQAKFDVKGHIIRGMVYQLIKDLPLESLMTLFNVKVFDPQKPTNDQHPVYTPLELDLLASLGNKRLVQFQAWIGDNFEEPKDLIYKLFSQRITVDQTIEEITVEGMAKAMELYFLSKLLKDAHTIKQES